MAKDAVDEAVHGLERSMDRRIPESATKDVPLLGAEGYEALWNSRHRLSASSGLHLVRIEHLLQRYGSLVDEVLELVAQDRTLGEPLEGTDDYLRAEVVYAVTHEGARHLDDVLTRRTRISIETFHRGTASARDTASLMGAALGWSDEQRDREVEHYLQRVAAERESQEMPDDQTADAARLGAPDVVPLA
jgi:glycerol-3-phosphate dehydrogenase